MFKTFLFILLVCVSVSAQTDLTNINKLETNSAPAVKIDVDGPTQLQVLRIRNNEAGSADHGILRTSYSGNNGASQKDHVMCIFYNCQGLGHVNGEPEASLTTESRYKTNNGIFQSEIYFTTAANGFVSRPFAIDLYHSDGSTQVSINSKSFFLSNPSQSNIWLRFTSSDTDADMTFFGDSGVNYAGDREWMWGRYGLGVIGSVNNKDWGLFRGGLNGETLNIFKNSDLTLPLTIKVGNQGAGLKVESGNRWQGTGPGGYSPFLREVDPDVEATADTVVRRDASGRIDAKRFLIDEVQVVGKPCSTITLSDLSQADNGRAVNQVIQCLQDHGLVSKPLM